MGIGLYPSLQAFRRGSWSRRASSATGAGDVAKAAGSFENAGAVAKASGSFENAEDSVVVHRKRSSLKLATPTARELASKGVSFADVGLPPPSSPSAAPSPPASPPAGPSAWLRTPSLDAPELNDEVQHTSQQPSWTAASSQAAHRKNAVEEARARARVAAGCGGC